MREVLIIDDNRSSHGLGNFLRSKGYSAIIANDFDEGLQNINKSENLKVVLLSAELSGISSLKALENIKGEHPEVIVIVVRAGVNTARKATVLGALDVLSKPIDMEHIDSVLKQAFERLSIRSETSLNSNEEKLKKRVEEWLKEKYPLVGENKAMFELNKAIGRVARNKVSVLLEGETGTGKGVVARLIHEESGRAKKPFITIDCGAIPSELLENELFGHEKEAFTDAKSEKRGKFEEANKGTLFLDEISNMTPALQMKLLNVLQIGEVTRLGGTEARSVDVRVISATNQKLREMVGEETFRLDLFHRLCGYEISLPPLRERVEDISLLVPYFLQRIEEENGRLIYGVSEEVMELLKRYNWPGNVRELENCLKSATVKSQGERILPKDLPEEIQMYEGGRAPEGRVLEMRFSETPETPMYKNLFDLPVVVFCQFISDAKSGVTDEQIVEWWSEFSNDGRNRANKAERKIGNWLVDWNTCWFSLNLLSERIKAVIDDAISQLLNLRHRIDSEQIVEAEPVSIEGRTLDGSLTAVLHEIVKEHGGNKENAAKELDISVEDLERWLLYWAEDGRNDTNNSLQTSLQPSRQIALFPYDELIRLLTEPIIVFILEAFSRREWRDKSLSDQMRTVHLALKVLSKRLVRNQGYIYFGGMTFSQIEENIYRRAPYLYKSPTEAAEALGVVERTFRKRWPKDKLFPSHPTLFTG